MTAIQAAQDALDAAKSERLASLSESKAYELDGASSIRTWARNELRLDASETDRLVRAGSTMRDLPGVGEAARAGRVRTGHLDAFSYGLRHLGRAIIARQDGTCAAPGCHHTHLEIHAAWHETLTIRRLATDLRHRHDRRQPHQPTRTPLRT